MKGLLRLVIVLVALCAFTGCYSITYTTNRVPSSYTHSQKNHFFIGGLVGDNTIDTTQICPNGAAQVRVYQTFIDSLISGLTSAIYTPRTADIVCAEKTK